SPSSIEGAGDRSPQREQGMTSSPRSAQFLEEQRQQEDEGDEAEDTERHHRADAGGARAVDAPAAPPGVLGAVEVVAVLGAVARQRQAEVPWGRPVVGDKVARRHPPGVLTLEEPPLLTRPIRHPLGWHDRDGALPAQVGAVPRAEPQPAALAPADRLLMTF